MVLGHIGNNNSVFATAYWYDENWPEVYNSPEYGRWHRSKDKQAGDSPFASYMMNKKWTLEEEFNNLMLRFQQVTVSYIFSIKYSLKFQAGLVAIEVGFKVEHPDDKPEPLEMEHFYFPLGLWTTGLVISALCLLAEIIVKCFGNR